MTQLISNSTPPEKEWLSTPMLWKGIRHSWQPETWRATSTIRKLEASDVAVAVPPAASDDCALQYAKTTLKGAYTTRTGNERSLWALLLQLLSLFAASTGCFQLVCSLVRLVSKIILFLNTILVLLWKYFTRLSGLSTHLLYVWFFD